MKKRDISIYNVIFTSVLMMLCLNGSAQSFNNELFKYWYYRDRLNYFVSPGSDAGQSILFSSRNPFPAGPWPGPSSTIDVTQPHMMMGFYVGMLATEYKLLKNNGQTYDANSTLEEIILALDALIRMDRCEDEKPWVYSFETFDGFFVREDVPAIIYPTLLNDLNAGLASEDNYYNYLFSQQEGYVGHPIPIASDAARVQTRFDDENNFFHQNISTHDPKWSNYEYGNETYWKYWKTQKFVSQDELIGMLMGLALVVKLVDVEEAQEKAIQLVGKTVSFAKKHPECIVNDDFSEYCNNWRMLFPDGDKITDGSGGNTYFLGWGIIRAGREILGNNVSDYPVIDESVGKLNKDIYDCAVFLSTTSDILDRNNECMIARLQAISDYKPVFNSGILPGLEYFIEPVLLPFYAYQLIHNTLNNNGEVLDKISDNHGWAPFYPALWAVLHTKDLKKHKYNYDFRLLLEHIQSAPCSGPYNYLNTGNNLVVSSENGWASYLKYQAGVEGQNGQGDDHFGAFSGIDYMLLYNLACLAFPDGFDYDGQHYSFPYYFNQINRNIADKYAPLVVPGSPTLEISSTNYPEEIRAITSITSDMIVSNRAQLQLPMQSQSDTYIDGVFGDVTLKAGESIKLIDGFRVDAGAHFLARIESYSCNGLPYKNMAAPPWSENYRGCYYDTLISVPMDQRAPIVYSEDNYEEEDFDMSLWEDYYMYDTTAATELAVGVWLNPNPCANNTTLTLVSESEQFLTIELFDMTGQKRATLFEGIADNNFTLDVDMSFYAKGMYLLRISGAGGSKVVRFVKE